MLDLLFDNVGLRLKILAKVLFVIEALGAVIAGLVYLFKLGIYGWWGFLIAVLGPIFALFSSYVLYALGEIANDTAIIRRRSVALIEQKDKR